MVSSTGKLFKGKGIKQKCFEHARTHEYLEKKKKKNYRQLSLQTKKIILKDVLLIVSQTI